MTKEECEVETSKAIMEMRNHIEEFEKELEKEADNFCDKVNKRLLSTNYGVSPYSNRVSILDVQEAYIAGAEPREKRIAELEKENEELKDKLNNLSKVAEVRLANWQKYEEENKELKELVEKYRQAVDKCLHITFMGGGCEVHTIGQYATLVDGYLTDVEGLAKWKN